jgi:hypothetical protein
MANLFLENYVIQKIMSSKTSPRPTSKRLLTYGPLAVLAYAIGSMGGGGTGFAVFIAGGVIFEVLFWVELVRKIRRR